MINYNYHCHTKRCHHAIGEDAEYIIKAIDNNISYMGFSDHCAYPNIISKTIRMNYDQIDEYYNSIDKLRKQYKDQINIAIGLECEYYKEFDNLYKEYYDKFDYLILGQHGSTPYAPDFYHSCNDQEVIQYVDLLIEGIKSGYFKYVCHPDYFMTSRDSWSKEVEKQMHRLFKTCQEYNMIVEINCRGMKNKHYVDNELTYLYPYFKTYEVASQYNLKFVVGLDCHDPKEYDNYENLYNTIIKYLASYNLDIIENFTI